MLIEILDYTDSALGSGVQSRDSLTQAIMPIRGKSLNAQRATINKILDNKEFNSLSNAIGAGIAENFDYKKSRYGKIILLSDRDDDGLHIQLLLLTFFFNFMKPLIEEGMVYIAQPPLYRARIGNNYEYIADDEALQEFKKKHTKFELNRFKGLM